jgi:hypothetical protein
MKFKEDEHSYLLEEAENIRLGNNLSDAEYLYLYLITEAKRDERELKSKLTVYLTHLFKCLIQPEKTTISWHNTIRTLGYDLIDILESKSLFNIAEENFKKCYDRAFKMALTETNCTLDKDCLPNYTLTEIINEDFIDNFLRKYPVTNNDTYY